MSGQVWFPLDEPEAVIWVDANNHGPGYKLKVSYGSERWDRTMVPGIKVQVFDGQKVLGRQSPTYTNEEELQGVLDAIKRLRAKYSLPKKPGTNKA